MRSPSFQLDPRLEADSIPVLTLGLSEVRLHRDSRYPWLVLVPQVPCAVEILDLTPGDQDRLWEEIRQAAVVLRHVHQPTKLNVAALGNQVSQLHVHIIARFASDAAWPGPIWGAHPPLLYGEVAAAEAVDQLRRSFAALT